jgi:hypothetical protein
MRHLLENICRLGRGGLLALALVASLSGCAGWKPQEKGFRETNDLPDAARKARSTSVDHKADKDKGGYWSFSEKASQIERDLDGQ